MPKVKRPLLIKAISVSELLLDRLPLPGKKIFHEAGRLALSASTSLILQGRLNARARGLRVEVRHSAKQPGQFHILRSDVDVALVAESPLTPALIAEGRAVHSEVSRWIPWLGEMELYTRDEWVIRSALQRSFDPLLELIWCLRKWGWQRETWRQAPTPYHRRKAGRSIEKIRERIGIPENGDGAAPIAARLERVGVFAQSGGSTPRPDPSLAPAPAFLPFLGWEITPGAVEPAPSDLGAPLRLGLPPELTLAFMAMLPDGDVYFPAYAEGIATLRSTPAGARGFAAVCAAEVLLSSSHQRVYGTSETLQKWVDKLMAMIRAHDTALAARLGGAAG